MEQERGGGGGGGGRVEEMKGFEQQDQSGAGGRFVMKQNQNYQQAPALPPPSQNQPQKCPRCESLNTKFCYYNNYSLSQPRYFCKTCRRYWTQGGTLRNVPVGGGCRKGKRLKKPSSSSSSACALDTTSANKQNQATPSAATPSNLIDKAINTNISSAHPITPFNFPGAGFFSSLAAIQSFNGEFGGSNLALLQGFTHPSFYHHQQQQLQQQQQNLQFHQTPQTQTHVFNNLVNSEEALEENGILPNRTSTPTTHQEWPPQSFNATDPITSSQAGYWSNNNNNTSSGGGGSLNLNPSHHWVDLPGFGAPPSSTSPSSPPSFL